jgi:DNA polymerase III alpha subunit
VKIDLLGQRSLSLIADTVALVKRNYGIEVDPERIADGDPQAAEVLRHGRTLGCFQIESPGMRNLLVMMQAENRGDVIKGLSLIRPGPASSGMKERFVRRRRGLEETVYLTPQLREVLGETHGVMLYQEDILKVAQAVAGFSLAEGDQLRKAISKKRSREGIEALRERFLRGALARGVRREAVAEVWRQVANFAEYSYCKAHATTYGHISYAAVWLKVRYPAEFLASVINNQAGFYPPRAYLEEARRWGVRILPLDINESEVYFSARDRAMRVGFLAVKGLTQRTLRRLIQARGEHPFRGLADFHARVRPQQTEAEALILVGAFDRFGKTRPQLLWELELLAKERASPSDTPLPLGEETEAAAIPFLPEFSLEEKLAFEEEHLEMTPTAHPLAGYRDALAGDGLTRAAELQEHVGKEVRIAGWLTANRRAPTKDNLFMEFLTLEDETGLMEVTLFPATYQKFGHLIRSAGPYLVEGRVEEQFGAVTLRAERLQEMPRAKRAAGVELRGANPRGANPLSTPARGARMQAGRR